MYRRDQAIRRNRDFRVDERHFFRKHTCMVPSNTRRGIAVHALAMLLAACVAPPLFGADIKLAAPEPAWKSWILSGPPMFDFDVKALKQKLAQLPEAQRSDALRYIFDTWDVKFRKQFDELASEFQPSLRDLVARWSETDFETVFHRAEEWDGFRGTSLRVALVSRLAQRNPLDAARFMSDRLNPMDKHYYYYVLMDGLVPSLRSLPVRDLLPIFEAFATGVEFMDTFRWGDGVYTLALMDGRWQSPDLDADWNFVVSQEPGSLRDQLLGMVLEARLERDLATTIKMDIAATGADLGSVDGIVEAAFPYDSNLAIQLLPHADPWLMDLWIRCLISKRMAPDWEEWAEQILKLPPGEGRDAALSRFMRLRLKYDEFPARQWSATLADQQARAITEREVSVSEIIHRADESWSEAYDAALALTDADCRHRALMGVFEAATNEDEGDVLPRAKTAARGANEATLLLDSWTQGRILAASRAGRNADAIKLILTLREPSLRRGRVGLLVQSSRSVAYDKVRQFTLDSELGEAEKQSLCQALALDHVDALLEGYHAPEEEGGIVASLRATTKIDDPRLRFIQQRSVVHDDIKFNGSKKVNDHIEAAGLDADTRARLLKEAERVSRWHRVER